jgi:hypothetical protein
MEDGKRTIDSRQWSNYRWTLALRRIGLRHRRMYSCRHTYISLALSYGAPPLEVAKHCATSVRSIELYYATFILPRTGDPLTVARERQNAAPHGALPNPGRQTAEGTLDARKP